MEYIVAIVISALAGVAYYFLRNRKAENSIDRAERYSSSRKSK